MKTLLIFLLIRTTAFASTSEENRAGKDYQINLPVPIYGTSYGLIANSGIEVGHFKEKNHIIGFQYIKHKNPNYEDDFEDSEEYQGEVFEIFSKKFHGNSYYVKKHFYYRHAELDSSNNVHYSLREAGVGFNIGNQWQWKNFTIGCDWFGLNARLVTFKNEDTRRESNAFILIDAFESKPFLLTVHHWHFSIREYHIKFYLLTYVQCLNSVCGGSYFKLREMIRNLFFINFK